MHFKEFLMREEADSALQALRDQLHSLQDQVDDITSAGGEIPPNLKEKMQQLQTQIDAKKKELGMEADPNKTQD